MTPTGTKWLRVNRELPCPVCGKPDWCLVAADASAAICPRTESPKRCGSAGYLHRLVETLPPRERRRVVIRTRSAPPDLTALATEYQRAATDETLTTFAANLGVRVESLRAFGVGWAPDHRAWSFPMRDPTTGTATGIRLRRPNGTKFSVRGSREGLFMPDTLPDENLLLILEGATDAVAAHSIGFPFAVGRPSCTGGGHPLVALVWMRKPVRVVIVRDNDVAGERGAEALARVLILHCRDLRVVAPPADFKDVRQWVTAGASRRDLKQLVHAASARRLVLNPVTKGDV
jgi:hypothetical protein